jgi:hypothetical protein
MSACPTITSSSTAVSRTPSTKRKRTAKSPPDADSPLPPSQQAAAFTFEARLFQLQATSCGESAKDAASSTPHPPVPKEPKNMECASSSVAAAVCLPPQQQFRASSPPSATGQLSETSWSFLAHPALRLLPKWPALYTNSASTVKWPPVEKKPEHPIPDSKPLSLLALLDITPIAASLASHLYGHDLLSLRCLNRSFLSLLSSERAKNSSRTYYHVLLLKTLLCPREDVITEPVGTACRSAGGNVGPCVFCANVICTV